MTDHPTSGPVLVAGGTGRTGRRVAAGLADRGVSVRLGARSAPARLDWEDPTTFAPALEGARAAYVAFAPDLAVPGAAETVARFAEAAVDAGVERLVLLSGRGEEGAQRAEAAVRALAPRATVVRSSWFSQNFSESFLLDAVRAGVVALPVDGVPEPFVDAGDVAEVAVAAMTEDGHEGRVYEVTGPRLLTFADAVGEIAAATGRPVRLAAISHEEHAAALGAAGVPPEAVALLGHLFAEVLDGRNASLTSGVQEALGRPPRDFADYARATAATGAWAPA